MPKDGNVIHSAETLREQAEELLKKTPEDFTISAIQDINRLVHELQVHQIELQVQNEELKRAHEEIEESRNKYFELFDLAPIGYFTIDLKGMIEEVNLTGASMLKMERSGILKKSFSSFVDPDYQNAYFLHRKKVLESQTKQTCELRLVDSDGSLIDVQMDSDAVLDSDEKTVGIRSAITDITKLRKALLEKEVLLKEVHHRIKNNMQVISSLLNLQAARVQEPTLKAAFQESQNRVRAMAVVHETIYQSETFSEINLKPYIRKLAQGLFQSYNTSAARVVLRVNAEDVFLNIDEAIPCGLILNELISNSLKHAFPEDCEGAIIVDLHLNDQKEVVLSFRDDGVGFPESFDIRKVDTLGLSLVMKLMERQLDGKMEISQDKGLKYTFTFSPRQNG